MSARTWDDFETLFAEGTGWGRCGCLFALDAQRATKGGSWAQQRRANLATMRGLVERRRSRGILVYDRQRPVGWCQYVPRDELRPARAPASEAAWFVTCFVIQPQYRGLGATSVALRAAVEAIAREGGGVVEGHATPIASEPPPEPQQKGVHFVGDVLFFGGSARINFASHLDGVGRVAALYRSKRSMHAAPLGGTVELYRREGFQPVGVLPRPASGRAALGADRIIMRRTV